MNKIIIERIDTKDPDNSCKGCMFCTPHCILADTEDIIDDEGDYDLTEVRLMSEAFNCKPRHNEIGSIIFRIKQ